MNTCLGEKPRREISENQYWSCQNATKIRWAEVCHQERWICTHSPFISELSGQNGGVSLYLHMPGPGVKNTVAFSQTLSITCPSPAAPLTWGRSSKHKQTENWALLGNFPFQENSTRYKNMFKPAFRYKIVSLHHRTYLCLKKQWSILANPTSSVFIPPSAYCCEASAPNTPLNSSKVQVTS